MPEQIGRHAKENGQGIAVEDRGDGSAIEELEEQANQAAKLVEKKRSESGKYCRAVSGAGPWN